MSIKPFSDDEIAAIRANPFDKERIWLATVDALQSRLAAAEAEAERAREALGDAINLLKAHRHVVPAHLASRPEGEVRHG